MTDLPAPFVLSTHLSTLICIDEITGELVHRFAERQSINLVFIVVGERTCLYKALSTGFNTSFRHHQTYERWDVCEDEATGATTLSLGGLFASAEPSGAVTMSRPQANVWEMFRRLPLIEAYSILYPVISRFRPKVSIPKTIHQTYVHRELPENLFQNVTRLREVNSDFDYKLWTDEEINDFIHDTYGSVVWQSFSKINCDYGPCRADLFRYLCIYKLGGVYLDIKSGTRRRLSDIIMNDDHCILSQWDKSTDGSPTGRGLHRELAHVPGGEYQQWHVIAAPGHPFLERVILRVLRNIAIYTPTLFGVGKIGALRLSGPIAYTLAIWDVIDKYPHRMISSQLGGLSYSSTSNYMTAFPRHYSSLHTPVVNRQL